MTFTWASAKIIICRFAFFYIFQLQICIIIIVLVRGGNRKLKGTVEDLKTQYNKCRERCQELTDQHRQQSILQEKMRQRIQAMDSHSQKCSQQVGDMQCRNVGRERRRHPPLSSNLRLRLTFYLFFSDIKKN